MASLAASFLATSALILACKSSYSLLADQPWLLRVVTSDTLFSPLFLLGRLQLVIGLAAATRGTATARAGTMLFTVGLTRIIIFSEVRAVTEGKIRKRRPRVWEKLQGAPGKGTAKNKTE